jgi:hypothetical protein
MWPEDEAPKQGGKMEEVIAKVGGGVSSIPPHPAGAYAMKCIDLIDYGLQDMTWQGVTSKKHRICLRFYGGQTYTDKEGHDAPLWVDQYMTLTLHENGALRPFLEAWRGKMFTDSELEGFNVAVLVGVDAWVTLGQVTKNDRTYCNILACSKMPPGAESPTIIPGYVRVKDREPKEAATPDSSVGYDNGNDLPF